MRRIALMGMPNTGKSTLFNRLTGAGARVGNWPGITVDLLSAKVLLGGAMVEVVDLPGIYNLHGFSEDEQVVRRFLESQPVNLLVLILNASQMDRQLALPLQLRNLDIPMIVLLNMADEAGRLGVRIDTERLEAALGCPVRMMSAKFGTGIEKVRECLARQIELHPKLAQANAQAMQDDQRIEHELDTLVSENVHTPIRLPTSVTDRFDRLLLHTWLGLPFFFALMFLVFQAVYSLGTPMQDSLEWLLSHLKDTWLTPMLAGWPPIVRSLLIEGLFDGVGTVLTFLPIIGVFFLAMAVVEDSGYLARAAFLTDALMSRFGLDGRAFVMQIMGLGCNVPAIMGTRIMRSPALRALTMLIIPFSLCSARLQVILFIVAAVFSPKAAPGVIFSLYLMSFLIAFLAAWLLRRRFACNEPLLLEMPPLRLPTWRFLGHESWRAMMQFLRGAGGFIIVGVILVWFLTHFPFDAAPAGPETIAGHLAKALEPMFAPLGIDQLLSVALLFGFVAKEVVIGALSVIYGVGGDQLSTLLAARLDWVQAYSFLLFTLIYTPCLSTVAVLKQESKSWRLAALSVFLPLAIAWLVSFSFYQGARALGY
jgi:ferrous iron transport protein B